jgi:peptidoglycan/xylan/chitin deacetylase (PgdA/CDA1 family)
VPVLAYHKVAEIPAGARFECNYVRPATFVGQLRWLRAAGYQSITFGQYLSHRQDGVPLPQRPILITFDDGYRSNLEIAAPILRRFGFTATVFVVTGLIGGTNVWDPDEIQEPLLSADEIRQLAALGFDIQSHTHTHARLTTLTPAEALDELRRSRMALADVLGRPASVIAYPWGDHSETTCALAAQAGYDAGVIVRRRTNFARTPMYALRRIGVNNATRLPRFAWDLARLRWRGD